MRRPMNGNARSYGDQALTEWSDHSGSLGAPSIGICGRVAEEGAVGAASRSAGTHGDPTLGTVMGREYLYYVDRAVSLLCDHDADKARMVAAYYLQGCPVEQAAEKIGVNRQRGDDLLWLAQAWVGSWLMREVPQHVVDRAVSED